MHTDGAPPLCPCRPGDPRVCSRAAAEVQLGRDEEDSSDPQHRHRQRIYVEVAGRGELAPGQVRRTNGLFRFQYERYSRSSKM